LDAKQALPCVFGSEEDWRPVSLVFYRVTQQLHPADDISLPASPGRGLAVSFARLEVVKHKFRLA